jgi:hypothetical protein
VITNPTLQRGLQAIGDAGWNLLPLPSTINNLLGKSAPATFSFSIRTMQTIKAEFEWSTGAVLDLIYGDSEPAPEPEPVEQTEP